MDPTKVLNAIAADDRITSGMFFRLTFAPLRRLGVAIEFFSFQTDMQALFDKLDAADGWAMPNSDLAVAPGQLSAVIDVNVRPVAVGITAADLANYFDDLRFGITLTSMTPIDSAAVIGGSTERSTLQDELSAAEQAKSPFAALGSAAKYLEWILILAIIVALLYYGEKAWKVAKAVA